MSTIEPGQDRTIGPEPVGPAPVDTSTAPPPEVTAPAEAETFPRSYVEDLRAENAKWRTQLRDLEGAFEGYEPEERAALVEFLKLSRAAERGDQAAAAQLEEMLAGDETPPETPAEQPMTAEDFRRLAREEAEQAFSQRETVRAQDDAVREIMSEARSLGYATNPTEKGYVDYQRLCYLAIHSVPEDTPQENTIKAAHEMLQAEKAAERATVIEEYLAGKESQAEGSLRIPNGQGAAPATAQTPRTFEEARQSLHERLTRGA